MIRLERSFRTALAELLRGTRRLTDAPVRGLRPQAESRTHPQAGILNGLPASRCLAEAPLFMRGATIHVRD